MVVNRVVCNSTGSINNFDFIDYKYKTVAQEWAYLRVGVGRGRAPKQGSYSFKKYLWSIAQKQ